MEDQIKLICHLEKKNSDIIDANSKLIAENNDLKIRIQGLESNKSIWFEQFMHLRKVAYKYQTANQKFVATHRLYIKREHYEQAQILMLAIIDRLLGM